MRVVLLTNQFLPRVGGAEVLTLREAVALRAMGHETRILTLRLDRVWPRTEAMQGVPVRRLGGLFVGRKLRLKFGAQWLAEARLWLHLVRTRHTYDVIHMRQISFLARPVALASRVTGKPVIVQIANAGPGSDSPVPSSAETTLDAGTALDPHAPYLRIPKGSWGGSDMDTLRASQWTARRTLRMLRHRAITLLSVSSRTTTYLLEDGLRPEQIVLLPTGIEPEQYAPALAHNAERAEHPRATPPTVLCVARYRYEKGLDYLLHAWLLVRQRVPDARLILAGGGQLQQQLAHMIAALGLGDAVDLAGVRDDVKTLLGEVDAFVLPSRYEGLPNALLEAMAAGLPCVVTRVSGCEDVVLDGQTGFIVPPGQPNALADALVRVLTQPELAHALGRAGRDRAVNHYDRRDLMRQLTDLYARVIAAANGQPSHIPSAANTATTAELPVPAAPGGRTR
jgi:glycosyltransferase involved in cell wall biosynthesis